MYHLQCLFFLLFSLSLSLFATPSHFFSTTCAHICLKNDVVVQFSSLPWPIVSTFSGYLNVNLVITAERGKRKTSGEKVGIQSGRLCGSNRQARRKGELGMRTELKSILKRTLFKHRQLFKYTFKCTIFSSLFLLLQVD